MNNAVMGKNEGCEVVEDRGSSGALVVKEAFWEETC